MNGAMASGRREVQKVSEHINIAVIGFLVWVNASFYFEAS